MILAEYQYDMDMYKLHEIINKFKKMTSDLTGHINQVLTNKENAMKINHNFEKKVHHKLMKNDFFCG